MKIVRRLGCDLLQEMKEFAEKGVQIPWD